MTNHHDATRLTEERPTEGANVIIMGADGHGTRSGDDEQRLVREAVQAVPHLVAEAALASPSTVDRRGLARQLSALLREPNQADDDIDAPPAASAQAQAPLRVPGARPEPVRSSPAPRAAVVRPARTPHRRGR
ncbi:hypothetical protein [Streptosporangium saharense]|uniref:hypothetical protein n=1 Tax=Streptosporangium saharense TaxID=1706840 RepID=UPI0034198880